MVNSALAASEARLRAFIEHAHDVVAVLALDGTILYESPAVERMLGFRPEAMVGRPATDFVHPDDHAPLAEALAALGAVPGAAVTLIYRCRHADGSWRTLEADARNLTAEPALGGIVVNVRDITARAAAELALRESEARLAEAQRVARLGDFTLDVARNVLVWSAELFRLFGREPGDVPFAVLPREQFYAAIHPDDRERVREAVRVHMQHGDASGVLDIVYPIVRADDGAVRVLRTRFAVRRAADGAAERVVGTAQDITEQVDADAARRVLEAQLQQAQKLEALGQLAGGVAHDFNNLLTVVSGNLEFLRTDLTAELPSEHPAWRDLDEVVQATERARRLVGQLLTFSRAQPVQTKRLNVGDLVRDAERLLRHVTGEEVLVALHVADRDVWVDVDASQLEQVVLNLVVNARDAMLTTRHGHPGTGGTLDLVVDAVEFTAVRERRWDDVAPGRWVRVRVHDTGHGMDAQTRAHAFDPFFTTKDVGQGTGLGLATVFGIVRRAGGVVRIESAPGDGTTVTVLLPAVSAPAPAHPGAAATPSAGARGVGGTVLLVEDEAAVRSTARRVLERHGYAVLEARHGADALLVWREAGHRITVVVTDLRMPEMGGGELIARLRAEHPGLPVLVLSGYADPNQAVARGPATGFLAKPFTGEALVASVAQVLAAAHADRPRAEA